MQSSSLLAMIAPTMLVGLRLSPERSPRIFVALWLLVTLATCWICWLAVLDAVSSARHFHRLARVRAATREGLKHDFAQIIAARGRTLHESPDSTPGSEPSQDMPNG
jgi:hypothetical protein